MLNYSKQQVLLFFSSRPKTAQAPNGPEGCRSELHFLPPEGHWWHHQEETCTTAVSFFSSSAVRPDVCDARHAAKVFRPSHNYRRGMFYSQGLTRPDFQGHSPPIAVSAFFPSGLRYGSHSSLSSLPGLLRCTSMLRHPAPLLSEPTGIIKPQHTAQEPFPASKPPSFLVAIPGKLLFCCPSFCGGA